MIDEFEESQLLVPKASEGLRNRKRRVTMVYYQLRLQTIFKKLLFAGHRNPYFMQFG